MQDLARVERVHPADALDQRRLAGAVVAEKRQHLAAVGFEAHVLQRMHGAEVLLGVADGEDGDRAHCALTACSTRARASRWLRSTSASTATTTITPMAIIW